MTWGTTASWITGKRLRVHGLILALCLWSVYFWNVAAPGLRDRASNLKGTDFLHFYTLGSLALAHRGADLYDMQAQAELAAQRVPAAAGIRYLPLYPPQVSIFFAPFARLPYACALILWLALSSFIYGVCCYAIWRACPKLPQERFTVLILAVAFPGFWHLTAWGQTSALALACFTLAFFALRAERGWLAGLAIGCLIFKPQLAVAAALVFVLTRQWKIISGAVFSAAAQLSAGWLYYGSGPFRDWLRSLRQAPHVLSLLEPKPYQTHCLRTFWTLLVPWVSISFVLYLVTAVVVSVWTIGCWRSSLSLPLRYSSLLLATALLAPHLTAYDLVIVAPAFLLLSDWIVTQPELPAAPQFKLLLYAAFAFPLLGPLARWTHLQLSVPVMAALLYGIWKLRGNSIAVRNSL